MRIALVQFTPWDKIFAFDPLDLKVKEGNLIVVTTEFGLEIGKILEFKELSNEQLREWREIRPIDRLATDEDLKIIIENNNREKKEETLKYCRKVVKKHHLEMKLIDCYFSFDDQRLVIAFIADGRVDFRDLVKDITRYFQRPVRLHQLGVRDEAKIAGDLGSCGKPLCCRGCLRELGSVTSELAEQQQVAHRGAERLSGVCGRLKCCLAFEKELYEELAKKLPAIGTRVKTKHGRGEVISWHVLRGSVDVRIDPASDKEEEKEIITEVMIP